MMSNSFLYVIGNNKSGEFGRGHNLNFSELELVKTNISSVYCGNKFSIYCNDDNSITNYWSCGYNGHGQLAIGFPMPNTYNLIPIKYFENNNINIVRVFINVSGLCVFWLSDTGKLYGNGYNGEYQLGIHHNFNQNEPTLIDNLYPIYDIQIAYNYCIALCVIDITKIINYWTKIVVKNVITIPNDISNIINSFYGPNSFIYSTSYSQQGGNGQGKGYDTNNSDKTWNKIDKFNNVCIVSIATGRYHSLFLDSNGSVWSCGRNVEKQLGRDVDKSTTRYTNWNRKPKLPLLNKIKYFSDNNIVISDIKCGWYHNIVRDINGKIYSWGSNEFGQCGISSNVFQTQNNIPIPTQIKSLKMFNIIKIKCGAFHSYAMSDDKQHFIWGSNDYNECIFPKNQISSSLSQPQLINNIINKKFNDKEIKDVYLGVENTKIIMKYKDKAIKSKLAKPLINNNVM